MVKVDEIDTYEGGRRGEILFSILPVRQQGIRPVPDEKKLGLKHYPEAHMEF